MFRRARHRTIAMATAGAAAAALAAAMCAASPAVAAPSASAPAPDIGACSTPGDGRSLAVTGASANVEVTEAWRQFGNTGGGWANEGGWAAADGTYSTVNPEGEVIWLFNDTWLGPVNADESLGQEPGLVNNSIVLGGADGLPDTTLTGGTQDAPTAIAGPRWLWNEDGIYDAGKLQLIEFEQGLTDDPPPWNFGWIGTTLVTFDDAFQVESVAEVPMAGNVSWGVELVPCDGFVYIYGVESVPFDKIMHLARAPEGRLADIAAWEYFDGAGWSSDPHASSRIMRDVGASYSVTPIDGKWVLTTTDSTLGDKVYVAVADAPTGPFTGRQQVYVAPEAHSGRNLYAPYNIAAHPSISKPGTLTISYNVNSAEGIDGIRADANNNRPRFIDIHLASVADTTRPTATLVTPTGSGPFRTLSLRVDASDDSGLQRIVANVYRGSTLVKSTQTATGGARSGSHVAELTLPDGAYTIKYNAHDVAGNVSATSTFPVTVDATAPVVTVKQGPSFTVERGGAYDLVSFKLNDPGKIDKVTINGVTKDLTDNAWSDVNFTQPGTFGAVRGQNSLVAYDVAGNTTRITFTLN